MPQRQHHRLPGALAPEPLDLTGRDEELARKPKIREFCLKLYNEVEQGFQDQADRSDDNMEMWDIYNCALGGHQFYQGNSKIFLPIVADAVNARKTRFSNQLFPRNGRYIDVITDDETIPHQPMALAENYVRRAKLRSLVPALLKNGDVEGQYTIYVEWNRNKRVVAQKKQVPLEVQVSEDESDTEYDPDHTLEDIEEIEVPEDYPIVEIIPDSDICVLPATSASLGHALDQGGSVTIIRRWSKAKVKDMVRKGHIDEEVGEWLIDEMGKDLQTPEKDIAKRMLDAAGIKKDGRGKYCLVYETWAKAPIDDRERICRMFFAGQDKILSVKLNPLWCDRIPIISAAVEKLTGSFKGTSRVRAVKDVQYYANDVINEAADSSAFSMMPIIMSDPEKNPDVGSMVLTLGAVWLTSPKDTQFAQFPPLWRDGLEIVAKCREQIFQTLSVNPAQITQQSTGKVGGKRNQAEIANEQQVDILTTIDATTVLEETILSPMVTLFMEMDAQYRTKALTVPRYGELGRSQQFQEIPPLQMDRRYQFVWMGVEAARANQELQQQIAFLNVLKGIPPQSYPGYQLQLAPAIVNACERVFGPRLAPQIFVDVKGQVAQDPEKENRFMMQGIKVTVHSMDDHARHIAVHERIVPNDITGTAAIHIVEHKQAMQQAMIAQQQAQNPQQKGVPGSPGAAGQPGVAGRPRPGAQPAPQRPMQQPAGAIHRDRMPLAFPRKM